MVRAGDLDGSAAADSIRGTQSFVRVMQWCWQHPGVVALEVCWRWVFGVFALGLLWRVGGRVLGPVLGGGDNLMRLDWSRLGLSRLELTAPMGAAAGLADAIALLLPPLLRAARWLAPLLLLTWLAASSLGRTAVLRHVDRRLSARPVTLGVLQLIRVVALGATFALWFAAVRWAGAASIAEPLARGEQPELVQYFAVAIIATLGLFSAWAVVSWVFSLPSLLAMARGLGVGASLRAARVRGPLRTKLIEINLVMGIVKIALVVLAMVLSACPLPFQSVVTPGFLFWWNAGVALLYLLGSDFFHVARQVAYLELWRAFEPADSH